MSFLPQKRQQPSYKSAWGDISISPVRTSRSGARALHRNKPARAILEFWRAGGLGAWLGTAFYRGYAHPEQSPIPSWRALSVQDVAGHKQQTPLTFLPFSQYLEDKPAFILYLSVLLNISGFCMWRSVDQRTRNPSPLCLPESAGKQMALAKRLDESSHSFSFRRYLVKKL